MELRSVRATGMTAQEEAELTAAENEERQKRKKVDDAARVEYLIRDAMAQGKFDNLKHSGKPIPGLGERYDPDWWVKGLIQREHLSGLGPKAILLRTEDTELDAKLDALYSEMQVRELVEDFNARVIDARRQLQGGPPVITKTRDIGVELERWRRRRVAAEAAAAEAAEALAREAVVRDAASREPSAKRPWWRRIWNGSG